ncbi:hypothetical protein PRIPAC_88854 [Pristionchus pacificus]|uniref:UPAR/Ly6 domain-containing protein n=1 Tax=Pristionchus pacificus TaxID=54126 RepID=A0A8R1YLV9_PRIPA|nr:hypothetical protein PRIPAC_88854 [Pristionchus pacificus]|eukprot:PDM62620.1 hypothetical protein PRIPAC_52062 [Pristionchus pacificus]
METIECAPGIDQCLTTSGEHKRFGNYTILSCGNMEGCTWKDRKGDCMNMTSADETYKRCSRNFCNRAFKPTRIKCMGYQNIPRKFNLNFTDIPKEEAEIECKQWGTRCFSGVVTNAWTKIELKGCGDSVKCTSDGKSQVIIQGYAINVTCCTGHMCNAPRRPKVTPSTQPPPTCPTIVAPKGSSTGPSMFLTLVTVGLMIAACI